VVYNPVKVKRATLERIVAEREALHGWGPSEWFETTVEEPGTSMAREAVAGGARLVIAAGGDGTIRAVAGGIENSGVAMGIVPLGTGNLLARNLEIPIDSVETAVAVAMSGAIRSIDMGRVTFTEEGSERTEVFLVMLGVGMDAEMIDGTDDRLKKQVGWVAYASTFTRSVFTGHRIRASYLIDDDPEPRDTHARTVLVGNCGVLQGGMVLMPGALLNDGLFDVVALRPKGVAGWLRLAYAVLVQNTLLARMGVPPARRWAELADSRREARREYWRRWTGFELPRSSMLTEHRRRVRERRADAQTLVHDQGRRIEVRVADSPAALQIDGDTVGRVDGFVAEVRSHALALRVPF